MSSPLQWLNSAVFYQVYPQSYFDSNGDGVGDIPGLIQKLDYIESLGVNGLWINPCFDSPFMDAGYDVRDFYKVAPRYGSNTDIRRLFKEAHRRDIRVCLDFVAGHTSIDHPWFRASCRHKRNAYSHRYIWTDSVWDHGDESIRFVSGVSERDGNFAVNFFSTQPALNYGYANPQRQSWQQPIDAPGPRSTRAELKKIMRYWLDMGADGFRVDMASSLVKNDPRKHATIALWQEIREWIEKFYPEAILISEWSHPAAAIRAGFHIDFMIHFGIPGYSSLFFRNTGKECFFDSRGKGNVRQFLDSYFDQLNKTRNQGYISLPSGNHDIQRLNNPRTQGDLKVIFTFLLTWPGVPFIYYGDEVGLRFIPGLPSKEGGYNRTGSRTPMQWSRGENAGFSKAKTEHLYLPIDPRRSRPNVETQSKSSRSLLNHVRKLIKLRRNTPALQGNGDLQILHASPSSYPLIYLRRCNETEFIISLNPSSAPVSVTVPLKNLHSVTPIVEHGIQIKTNTNQASIIMSGVSYGIHQVQRFQT